MIDDVVHQPELERLAASMKMSVRLISFALRARTSGAGTRSAHHPASRRHRVRVAEGGPLRHDEEL